MTDKAKEEKAVFEDFASAARLDIDPNTIKTCEPPEPDIRCRISGEYKAVELTEIVDSSRIRGRSVMLRGIEDFDRLLADLPPDHPLKTGFSDTGFQVTFHDDANELACRNARAALIDHLIQEQSILKIGGREFVQIPSTKPLNAIKNVNVIRGYPHGPSISASGGGAVNIPIIEAVEAKFAKSYETDVSIELLAYFDTYRSLDEARWIPILNALVDAEMDKTQFNRVWVYDRRDNRVIYDSDDFDSA